MEEKKRVWGQVLVVEPRQTYYTLPKVHLGSVVKEYPKYLTIKLPNGRKVTQVREKTLCVGRKADTIKELLNNFQLALDELKSELSQLKTYNLLQTETVIMAEIPSHPTDCTWGFWEVDYIVRAKVVAQENDSILLLDLLNCTKKCFSDTVLACPSDQVWEAINDKYEKVQQSQKYLIKYLESLTSYDQKIKQSRNLKLVEPGLGQKVDQLKDALIANPGLSLRSTGELVGLNAQTTSRYYKIIQQIPSLTDKERELIARDSKYPARLRLTKKEISIPIEEASAYKNLLAENEKLKEQFRLLAQHAGLSDELAIKITKLEYLESEYQNLQKQNQILQQMFDSRREGMPKKNPPPQSAKQLAIKSIEYLKDIEESGALRRNGVSFLKSKIYELWEMLESHLDESERQQATSQSA